MINLSVRGIGIRGWELIPIPPQKWVKIGVCSPPSELGWELGVQGPLRVLPPKFPSPSMG